MATDVSIRTASSADAVLLADLGARTFRATYRSAVEAEALEEYIAATFSRERLSAELADPDSTFLVALLDDTEVSYAHLRAGESPGDAETGGRSGAAGADVDGRSIELVRLYLEQSAIGTGIGATLLEASLERADENGYAVVWLGVWERNARAREFYRKWGFREAGSQEFTLGGDVHTDIVMTRGAKRD